MDSEELGMILDKLESLEKGLTNFQNTQFQADSELYQIILRLAHTKGYTQSWFSALNQTVEYETEDDQQKREETNCVAATAAFIKCIETQRFERAAITDRVDQVENEGGTWTYIMNGEEKVFSPVTVGTLSRSKEMGPFPIKSHCANAK